MIAGRFGHEGLCCNHCYWFRYASAHDQFARHRQSTNEPLRHHSNISHMVYGKTMQLVQMQLDKW